MSNYRVGATRLEPAKEEYQRFDELITTKLAADKIKWTGSIMVKDDCISIRADSWADYYLAKNILKGCVTKEIERDVL